MALQRERSKESCHFLFETHLWGRRIQVPIVPRHFVPSSILQSSLYRQRTQVQVPIMTRHFNVFNVFIWFSTILSLFMLILNLILISKNTMDMKRKMLICHIHLGE
jgi:hypothetical protein